LKIVVDKQAGKNIPKERPEVHVKDVVVFEQINENRA
jgi:hypothetical protein